MLPLIALQGDQRTHSHVVGLRAVTSSDGMTADWYPFSPEFLRTVSARICNQVRHARRQHSRDDVEQSWGRPGGATWRGGLPCPVLPAAALSVSNRTKTVGV